MEETPPHPPTPLRRRAQDKMGDDDKKALRELLLSAQIRRSDGSYDIPLAQKLSGRSYETIAAFIKKDAFLHAHAREVNANKLMPEEVDIIDTETPMPPPLPESLVTFTKDQYEEYQAMQRQQRKMLAKDWVALGMTEEAGGRMEHYARMGQAPMGVVLSVMGGQLLSNLEILDQIIKGDAEKILQNNLPDELDKKGERREKGAVERDWRYAIFAAMNLQLSMTAHAHKIRATMARVMKDVREMQGAKKDAAKGEFTARE